MKTAISVPDELFEEADGLAEKLGMSRSELYATAVAEYLAKHRDADVTAQLNAMCDEMDTSLDPWMREAAARTLRRSEW
jgi:metal-responsive CopG/Arc/MetJ family transcriptional regulator